VNEKMNRVEKDLIKRAETLIHTNKGILPRSSIGILNKGLQFAREKNDFSDLIEFVPMFEKKYIRLKAKFERETQENTQKRDELIQRLYGSLTKEQLLKELAKLQKESMELMHKWSSRRPDERTQRKCRISNRADAVAKEMMLIQDAIKKLDSNTLVDSHININKKITSRQKTSLLDFI